jgi:hypothetical protein
MKGALTIEVIGTPHILTAHYTSVVYSAHGCPLAHASLALVDRTAGARDLEFHCAQKPLILLFRCVLLCHQQDAPAEMDSCVRECAGAVQDARRRLLSPRTNVALAPHTTRRQASQRK